MKHLLTLALALILIAPLGAAAEGKNWFEGHEDAFESAAYQNGVLRAVTGPEWEKFSSLKKSKAIQGLMQDAENSIKSLDGPLLMELKEGTTGTLWVLPEDAKAPRLMESWDKSKVLLPPTSKSGRWFTYMGAGLSMSIPKGGDMVSMGYNLGLKLGTLLFKDLLDLGVSLNGGGTYDIMDTATNSTTMVDLGLFSRIHFPIAGPLGGNVGAEVSWNGTSSYNDPNVGKATSSSSNSDNEALLAGLSLFFPSGSLDFDVRISKASPVFSIGITKLIGGPSAVVPAK